jgi:hypothetical protein
MGRHLGVIDLAIRAKAKLLGAVPCECAEPDTPWDEEKQGFTGRCSTCGGTVVGLSSEEYVAVWAARGWTRETCSCCGGYGVYWTGEDVADCPHCCSGTVWRTPKGHYAQYPGGPFCG